MLSKISFIGGGNITRSLVSSCIQKNFPAQNIWVSDQNKEPLTALKNDFRIMCTENNNETAKEADLLVLAVKPQIVPQVATEIAKTVQANRPLVISLAPGISINKLEELFGQNIGIIRTMTNLCTKVGKGTTALFANQSTPLAQKEMAERFFKMAGSTIWVNNEEDINKITPIIGCGPAYLCLLIEAMENATIKLGISPEIARETVLSAIVGATNMLEHDKLSPAELRKKITTPNGVTDRSIHSLMDNNFFPMFEEAFQVAKNRSIELGANFIVHSSAKKLKNNFFADQSEQLECNLEERLPGLRNE